MIRAKRVYETFALALGLWAIALFVSLPSSAVAAKPTPPQIVRVTIFGSSPASCTSCPGKIVMSRRIVKRGPVTFKITNKSGEFAVFEIKSVDSREIGPNGGRAIVKVIFKRPGLYSATVPSYYAGTTGGLLRVT